MRWFVLVFGSVSSVRICTHVSSRIAYFSSLRVSWGTVPLFPLARDRAWMLRDWLPCTQCMETSDISFSHVIPSLGCSFCLVKSCSPEGTPHGILRSNLIKHNDLISSTHSLRQSHLSRAKTKVSILDLDDYN
jgi:hypothetical protein